MVVKSKVVRWGNSLGIRIQKTVADQLQLSDGKEVDIKVTARGLVITPSAPRYSLKSLMEKVDEKNIHRETETGSPIGAELW